MRSLMIAGYLLLLLTSGCISRKGASTSARQMDPQVAAPVVSDSQPIQTPPPASSPSQPLSSADDSGRGFEVTSRPAPSATISSSAKSKSSTGDPPIKKAGAGTGTPRAPAEPAQASSKPVAPPTLNLADLEQRLRDTHAIGVFTKLSLKNQVDDLLNDFRTLYKGPNKRPSAELRQRYDLLLLKVLSLLQDGDPSLAAAIASSRESIWGILADPDKFAKI